MNNTISEPNHFFDREKANQIADEVAQGVPYEQAAALCGVELATFNRWLQEDPAFQLKLQQAQAQDIAGCLKQINSDARHWRALAWRLERRYPALFGPKQEIKTEVSMEPKQTGLLPIDKEACDKLYASWQDFCKKLDAQPHLELEI